MYKYYNDKYVPRPFGLDNTGVICWCNSLLQMMLGLSSMNETLLSQNTLGQFAREYVHVVRQSLAGQSPDLSGAGAQIARAIARRTHIGNAQECADEAFTLFIQMLECPEVEKLFYNTYELIIRCDHCDAVVSTVRDRAYRILFTENLSDDKFVSHLRSHVSTCNYYKCEKCGNVMESFLRQERLRAVGEIIIIIFNKYRAKDDRPYPLQFSINSTGGRPPLTYKLVGKIEHSGNQFGGHYWAHSLRGDWFKLNDSSVSAGDPRPAAETYMIAYHMVSPHEDI